VPQLEDYFARFASPPIRNAATLAGNIANGSPIGDSMSALLALDASLVLRRGGDRREVSLDRFYLGYQQTELGQSEFIEQVLIPLPGEQTLMRAYKISKRFDQDISAVSAGLAVDLEGGRIADARLAYGGMAATPKRASAAEQALRGATWEEATIRKAAEKLEQDFLPISDMRASAGYRMTVAQNLLWKFWLESVDEQPATDVYGYGR
jgi:xanthine dehydrogenase small subunit